MSSPTIGKGITEGTLANTDSAGECLLKRNCWSFYRRLHR